MAAVSAIYERDVLLTYELTNVVIRTTIGFGPLHHQRPERAARSVPELVEHQPGRGAA
jgi:hypothetical protein